MKNNMYMKKNKIIVVLLIILIIVFSFNINTYAVTAPELGISSNNYSVGEKITRDEQNTVEVGKTLQLYSMIKYGNDMPDPDNVDSTGWYVQEINLTGLTWSSSDTSIATVDNTGKVTGIKEGNVRITVTNSSNETATKQIEVVKAEETENIGISVVNAYELIIPPESITVDGNNGHFEIRLQNIPDTEKKNVKISIEDESIAKVAKIDLCDFEDGSGKGLILVEIKGIKVGNTKLNAKITYNGKDYTDSCSFEVKNSVYILKIPSSGLPDSIKVGDKLQLSAILEITGGSVLSEDISNDVEWSSSNDNVAKVDSKGSITAIGVGDAIITAKCNIGDGNKVVTATYNIKVASAEKLPINPTATPNPSKEKLPQTGIANVSILIFIVIIGISIFAYIKYRKYKNIM